jgi:hypothetical protein
MPTPTYVALATTTLTSATTTITLSSIPSTFRDLVLIVNYGAVNGTQLGLRFNGDTGSNYTRVYGEYIYSSVGQAADTGNYGYVGAYDGGPATLICHIMDYATTDKHKTFLARGDSSTAVKMTALRWANTAAITSISVSTPANPVDMPIGTTINLYGIAS